MKHWSKYKGQDALRTAMLEQAEEDGHVAKLPHGKTVPNFKGYKDYTIAVLRDIVDNGPITGTIDIVRRANVKYGRITTAIKWLDQYGLITAVRNHGRFWTFTATDKGREFMKSRDS